MNQTQQSENARPEKVYGKAIRISVWRNEGPTGRFATFRLERRYKDTDGQWKSSNSLTLPQALRMQALLAKAVAEYVDEAADTDEAGGI